MAYRDALSELRRQRNVVVALCFTVAALAAGNGLGWYTATRDLPVLHIPPDLTRGVILRPGEVPAPNVYAFALYVWQQLNRWPANGQSEYPQNLFRWSAYLTPRFREALLADLRQRARRGELDQRSRGLQELPGHHYTPERVDSQSAGVWVVWLDLELNEHYRGTLVKTVQLRYPLRVVRLETDRARNPFGLALDGFATEAGPAPLPADGEGTP